MPDKIKKKAKPEKVEPAEVVEEPLPTEPEPKPEPKPEPVKEEPKATPKGKYAGLIMIQKSPAFKHVKGNPLELEDNEVVAVNPEDRRVRDMLSCGNAQFVSNKVKGNPRTIL